MLALAYLDVGLGLYALLLLAPSRSLHRSMHLLRKHSLLTLYTSVLVAASVWPLIVVAWLLSRGGDHD